MTESARRKTRNRPTKRGRELSDRPLTGLDPVGKGGGVESALLEPTPEGRKTQRLCERALLNTGFEVDQETQRDLVTAMAEIAFDAAKYDARRRTQAALTLLKFQAMRVEELHTLERLRLQESIGRGDSPLVQFNNVDLRSAVLAMQQDPEYVDYLNQKAVDAARREAE